MTDFKPGDRVTEWSDGVDRSYPLAVAAFDRRNNYQRVNVVKEVLGWTLTTPASWKTFDRWDRAVAVAHRVAREVAG